MPRKISALASAILVERAEEFQMHRRDRGDDRDMRAREPRQRLDLAGVVHAHFEHGITRARGAAGERQRHAPVIVVGGDRGVGLAVLRQREPQRFFGSGLADRAGDRRSPWPACVRAPRQRERASRRARRARPAAAHRRGIGAAVGSDDGEAGFGGKRRGDESWPSRRSPAMAKNASPRLMLRLSIEMPEIAGGSAPWRSAPIAAAISSMVHSADALMWRVPRAPRRRPRDR